MLFYIVHHLEQRYAPSHRLYFLRCAYLLLSQCGLHHDSLLPSRLARAVLPAIAEVLSHKADFHAESDVSVGIGKNRKGKKRARGYEGDEMFKVTRTVICSTQEDGDVILAVLDGEEDLRIRQTRSLTCLCSSPVVTQSRTAISPSSVTDGTSSSFTLPLITSHAALATFIRCKSTWQGAPGYH